MNRKGITQDSNKSQSNEHKTTIVKAKSTQERVLLACGLGFDQAKQLISRFKSFRFESDCLIAVEVLL